MTYRRQIKPEGVIKRWQMSFYIDKHKAIHLGKNNLNQAYMVWNWHLAAITQKSDLGVILDGSLKSSA